MSKYNFFNVANYDKGLSSLVAYNDLRANEGRETKALNCKPITNLKEKFELSNYCKSSGYRLHAVSSSALTNVLKIHAQLQMSSKT